MERLDRMICLDTHVAIWLAADLKQVSQLVQEKVNNADIVISPIVKLELDYLAGIGRITVSSTEIVEKLTREADLSLSCATFADVIDQASDLGWTRDPFDRIITADAICNDAELATKDKLIHKNYSKAIWE